MTATLGELTPQVARRVEQLQRERVVERIWEHDASLWPGDPALISNRLGWLTVAEAMKSNVGDLTEFASEAAADGIQTTVVLGMGGASLAPAVFAHDAPREVIVLDSTHPETIRNLHSGIGIERTLFIVSSKSGTTLETRSLFEYFWEASGGAGSRFVAITDADSDLARLGEERGFRRVFRNPEDVGGRFSALSYFGLVPASMAGRDLSQLLDSASAMFGECHEANVKSNPGAFLGAVLGEAALAGRNKIPLRVDDELSGLGTWIEQLLAESTGKTGRGILPYVDVPPTGRTEPALNQLLVSIGDEGGAAEPSIHYSASGADIGAEFARWEFATVVASHVIDVEPFDQPDVQSAKDATTEALSSSDAARTSPALDDVFGAVTTGGYVALLAYIAEDSESGEALEGLRAIIAERFTVATAAGFGPRYLHSTGQLHKGGPDGGIYVIIEDAERGEELAIPGREYGFRRLIDAQASGDTASLAGRGRVVARCTMQELQEYLDE